MNINLNSILQIKKETILEISGILNRQLILITNLKDNTISIKEFCRIYHELEDMKNALIEINDDCTLLIKTFDLI